MACGAVADPGSAGDGDEAGRYCAVHMAVSETGVLALWRAVFDTIKDGRERREEGWWFLRNAR